MEVCLRVKMKSAFGILESCAAIKADKMQSHTMMDGCLMKLEERSSASDTDVERGRGDELPWRWCFVVG